MEGKDEDQQKENCLPEVQWRWELGWKRRYQSIQRENLERLSDIGREWRLGCGDDA